MKTHCSNNPVRTKNPKPLLNTAKRYLKTIIANHLIQHYMKFLIEIFKFQQY